MKRYLTVLFFFVFYAGIQTVFAQCSNIVLKGYVEDDIHHPITNASIINIVTGAGVNVNSNGYFTLNITLPAKIRITALGYQTLQKEITQVLNCDTLRLTFTLALEVSQIATVTVTADFTPHCIVSADNLLDFEITHRQLCTLSTVSGGRRFCVYDSTAKLVARRDIKYRTDNLYRTKNDLVCVKDDDSVHFFGWDRFSGQTAMYAIPTSLYRRQIDIVTAMDPPYHYYYCRSERLMGGASLWAYDKLTGTFKLLYKYYNKTVAQRNRENMGEKMEAEQQTHNNDGMKLAMGGATINELEDARNAEFAAWGAWMFNYDALILLRRIRDSIYIFNFENDSMYVFDHNNDSIRAMRMDFEHRGFKYDKRDIVVNENENECYFTYNIHNVYYVDRIDLDNGKKASTNKLQFISIKKIRVQDNYAIYSYTDGAGKTYIYKQGIY